MISYSFVLFATIVSEALVYTILIKDKLIEKYIACILVNSFTNPLLNFLLLNCVEYTLFNFVLLEFLVVLVETILISLLLDLNLKQSFKVSFFANLFSASLSFVNLEPLYEILKI